MAYIRFSIKSVSASLTDNTIRITCTKTIDADSVTQESVILANKASHEIAYFSGIDVDEDTITLHLAKSPIVNSDYTLIVQDSIKDIVGESLISGLFRSVRFKSEITSTITLLTPADFEVVASPTFSWKEEGAAPVNRYRLQIAEENAFYNIVHDSVVEGKTQVELSGIKDGQYYIRIRAESGEDFGNWSDVHTFLIRNSQAEDGGSKEPPQKQTDTKETDKPEDPDDSKKTTDTGVEIVDDTDTDDTKKPEDAVLSLLTQPNNGVTPVNFSFIFDSDINQEGIDVSIIRSDF